MNKPTLDIETIKEDLEDWNKSMSKIVDNINEAWKELNKMNKRFQEIYERI